MPTPMPLADIFTESAAVVNDFGLFPFIFASAIAGMAAFLFRRFRNAAR